MIPLTVAKPAGNGEISIFSELTIAYFILELKKEVQ